MTLQQFNALDREAAIELLRSCCASRVWAERVADARSFESVGALLACAEERWGALEERERRAAIETHPAIGDLDGASSREREEQAGTASADSSTRAALSKLNREYRERFGFVFLTDANGRSASGLLSELRARLGNDVAVEHANAAEQQRRILLRRLGATLTDVASVLVSTHVLDTGQGVPAIGVPVSVSHSDDGLEWVELDPRITDSSGRIEAIEVPCRGLVRLRFATATYARHHGATTFFPDPEVTFAPGGRSRAHVPLLITPFGYSTYLGA